MSVMHFGKFCIIFTWIFRSSAPGVHQPSQGAFLQPGNIAAADAQLVGSLLLGSRTLPAQAVAQLQQRPFPHRQGIHQAAQAGGIGAAGAYVAQKNPKEMKKMMKKAGASAERAMETIDRVLNSH